MSSSSSSPQQKMIGNRVALLQLPAATTNKNLNIQTAREYILRAAHDHGASLCILPEMWNSPYATTAFPEYAEILPNLGDTITTCTISSDNSDTISTSQDDNGCSCSCSWGESATFLMNMAKMTGMYIVGGSIPEVVLIADGIATTTQEDKGNDEKDNKKLVYYNTCLIIDPTGRIVGKHRKLHLFDISLPNGGIIFKESDILSPGNLGPTYFDHNIIIANVPNDSDANDKTKTNSSDTTAIADDNNDSATTTKQKQNNGGLGRIGIGICYDIRFPEYAQLLTQKYHCTLLIYPGAFNLNTGPAHWELLQRARAVDNQCFVIAVSPARLIDEKNENDTVNDNDDDGKTTTTNVYPPYYAWGHSSIISPWGTVIATCNEEPTIIVADLDMNEVIQMRNSIPTLQQKRNDLYRLIEEG
jgi:omega-amidase